MPQRHPDLAFALEQLDAMSILGPFATKNFYGNNRSRAGIVGAEDPSETAGSDAIEYAVPTQEEPERVVLEQLVALPGGQVAFALEGTQQRLGILDARLELRQAL